MRLFHLLAYHKATGGASTDQQTPAVTDPEFTVRNNNFILTEQYKLLAAAAQGATLTRANFSSPTLNAWSLFNIWPLIVSGDMSSNPNAMILVDDPVVLPTNEEIQLNNTDGASENVDGYVILGTMDWNRNLPPGTPVGPVRATATGTGVIGSWVTGLALTFQQNLRGGVYSIVGAQAQGDDGLAFRIVFPRNKLYNGRRLRPGWLMTETIGDQPGVRQAFSPYWLGEWGRFHTFEPPTLDLYAVAADSVPIELRLWLIYLGSDPSLLGA